MKFRCNMFEQILSQFNITEKPIQITQQVCIEDGSPYAVWRIECQDNSYILKKAKGKEAVIYHKYLSDNDAFHPQLYGVTQCNGNDYLLMEYFPGNDLTRCNRRDLTVVLDAIIAMQSKYWDADMEEGALKGRELRGKYLKNPILERAYSAFLDECRQIPATLCHDDLLPFNVLISGARAVLIDWEEAGILPYPTSLARLIAHGEEGESAFFYMSDADKQYAIDYYFENLVKLKGISYKNYRKNLEFCLFYEYCEWVYVGNKYNDCNSERYIKYLQIATEQAQKMGF